MRIKCPSCLKKNEAGPPYGPAGSEGTTIVVKPGNIPGTTKSVLHCRGCGTTFLKGLGKSEVLPDAPWKEFVAFLKTEMGDNTSLTIYDDLPT